MTIQSNKEGAAPDRRDGLSLRCGDWVEVRSADEILATLDARGRFEQLPFQPEMLAFCGRRMRVAKVAHKTCDNIKKTGGRSMNQAVHLEGARCNGDGHGGCMADCVFFWKHAWLKRVGEASQPPATDRLLDQSTLHQLAIDADGSPVGDPRYVCQTTALFEATSPLAWWDARQYVRDVASGNHGLLHMLRIILFAGFRRLVETGYGYRLLIGAYNRVQSARGGKPFPLGSGTIARGGHTPHETLNLQVGEWVEIKSQAEILATVNTDGFNRGMRYDAEMSKYAGERHRVQMRVDRLIDEKTGKMLLMKSPCIQLEGVYCRAECTPKRLGCPRASNTYWREIWLRRVPQDDLR